MADEDDPKGRAGGYPQGPAAKAAGQTLMITPIQKPGIKVPGLPAAEGTPPNEAVRDLRGVVLDDRYVLQERVNGGNMGEIWYAKDKKLWNQEAPWLVKLLPSIFAGSSAYTEALLREAHITSGLNNDYFPLIVDVGVTDGLAWLVMQGLPGEDLRSYLDKHHPTGMSAKVAVPILLRILEGLSMAHAKEVIHRDIKPDNLLIEDEEGKPPKVRILDFGVAKAQSEVFATLSKSLPNGTQQYRPPEGHKPIPGPATKGGDVFAVGLTAYQMLLGRHPLAGGDYVARYKRGDELGALHEDKAGTRAGVDAALGAVLSKAVAFDPEKRYQDASEMLEALKLATTFRPEAIPVGAIIDRSYRVLGRLGKGGMGAVYVVKDTHRNKEEELLLKVLVYPSEAPEELQNLYRERFRRECESLYEVTHPCIPRIFSNGSHEGIPYLVMEKAKGDPLNRCFDVLLAKGGWDAVFHMSRGIAAALDAVHARGLIHRDIKPPNIVVDPDTGNVMVIDFGIVRVDDTALTADNTFIGTPGYAAPEQMTGDTVKESDQWSFGASLYYLLSGVHPGDLPDVPLGGLGKSESLNRLLCEDYPSLAELELRFPVPESTVNAVVKAMSHEPKDRFDSVTAFAKAMEVGVTEPKTPIAVKISLVDSAPPVNTTRPERRAVAAAATPQGLTSSTVATTDVVAHSGKGGDSKALLAGAVLLAVAGGAYGLARTSGSESQPSAASTETPEDPVVAQPVATVSTSDASVPVAALDAAVEVAKVNATVVTSYRGKLVAGLMLRIGDTVLASSESIALPVGDVVVHVGSGQYKGAYTCEMTPDSKFCNIELAKVSTKPHRPRRPRNTDDGEEDMINFLKDKPKSE